MGNQIQNLRMSQKFKKTPAGEIPVDWDCRPVTELAEVFGGGTPDVKKSEYWGGEINWATPTDVTAVNGTTISETKRTISSAGLRNSSANLMPAGSILMTSRATLGYAVINSVPMSTNQGFINFKCKESINNYFFMYYLRMKGLELERLAAGSTFLEIPKSALRSFFVPIPPIREQRKISEILVAIDGLIETVRSEIEENKELKKGLMRQLLTRGIGHKKFKKTKIGEIPENWRLVTFGEVFSFLRNGSNPRSELGVSGDVGYVHYGDLHTKWRTRLDCAVGELPKIESARVSGLPFVADGDLIVADASEDYAGVGVSVEVSNVGEQKIVAGLHTMLLRDTEDAFVNGFKGYIQYIPAVHNSLVKIATGGSVYGISQSNFQSVQIPCPPHKEQEEIRSILTALDLKIEKQELNLEKIVGLKKGLMSLLLTGKVRVNSRG